MNYVRGNLTALHALLTQWPDEIGLLDMTDYITNTACEYTLDCGQ